MRWPLHDVEWRTINVADRDLDKVTRRHDPVQKFPDLTVIKAPNRSTQRIERQAFQLIERIFEKAQFGTVVEVEVDAG